MEIIFPAIIYPEGRDLKSWKTKCRIAMQKDTEPKLFMHLLWSVPIPANLENQTMKE